MDEAFIDFSIPVRDLLLERYPYLAQPPPDAPQGLDTPVPPPPRISCVGLGNLIPVDPTMLDQEKEVTTEMVEELEKDGPVTWHDIGLNIAAELMAMMRREVHEKLGYLTSAVRAPQFCCFAFQRHLPFDILSFEGNIEKQIPR